MAMLKVKCFVVNESLMYLLQKTSNDSTEEILEYFYSLAVQIVDNHDSKKQKIINKTIMWRYKDGFIPYKLNIRSSYLSINEPCKVINIRVSFPNKKTNINFANMVNSIVENGLDLENRRYMRNFSNPPTRVPVCLKKHYCGKIFYVD